MSEDEEKEIDQRMERARRSVFTVNIVIPVLLGLFFLISPFFSLPMFQQYPGAKIVAEFSASIPLMIVGYFFGALGGVTRYMSEHGYFILSRSGEHIAANFVSGVLGMMTYLLLDSAFILKLIYPEISLPEETEVSFKGVAVSAFLVGFFSGETILLGRSKFKQATKQENES